MTYQSCHFGSNWLLLLSCKHNRATRTLYKWINILFVIDSSPIVEFKIKIKHFISYLSIFELTSVNNHGRPENWGLMVLSGQDIDSFSPTYVIFLFNCIIIRNLIGTFTNLSFRVEFKASSKWVDLIVVRTWCMSASSLDHFVRSEM